MDTDGKRTPIEVPKWDVALEAMVNEEHRRLGRSLTLSDLRRLGLENKVRLHDIMATIHQLERHGKWRHQGRDDQGRPMAAEALDALFVHGRLDEDLAERYGITWAPR